MKLMLAGYLIVLLSRVLDFTKPLSLKGSIAIE